jgi:hypothetical protein
MDSYDVINPLTEIYYSHWKNHDHCDVLMCSLVPELLQMSLCKFFRYLKITDQSTENEIDSIEINVSVQRR